MPLQMAPGQGEPPNAQSANRAQKQTRRRTLQTISELSSTDATIPSFASCIKPEIIQQLKNGDGQKKALGSSKRQSLPQYRVTPLPQPFVVAAPAHRPPPQHSHSMPVAIQAPNAKIQGNGYNAKRDRARSRHEQELAVARLQQTIPVQKTGAERLSISSRPSLSSITSRSADSHGRAYVDQQQLLRYSRSLISVQGFDQPSIHNNSEVPPYDHDTEPSERTSTASSSARDPVMGRSRSGSSNTSYTSQETPPLPKTPTHHQHYNTQQDHDLVSFGESARSKSAHAHRRTTTRTYSLPSHHSREHLAKPVCSCSTRVPPPPPRPTQHHTSPRRAHAEALAALTSADRSSSLPPSAFPPTTYTYPHANPNLYARHLSLTSHPPHPHRRHHHQSTSASASAPSTPRNSTTSRPSADLSLTARPVPRRESLTQWKAERDSAAVAAGGPRGRRAMMQERVRRANELEEAREMELVKMGKGRGREREAGCWGGLLGRVRGRG